MKLKQITAGKIFIDLDTVDGYGAEEMFIRVEDLRAWLKHEKEVSKGAELTAKKLLAELEGKVE